MHGFLIHTFEGHLLVRNYEYIKYDNPGWWQDNIHTVSSFWEFDSEKPEEMKAILESLRRISKGGMLQVREVELFCQSVGFDLEKFKRENASGHAQFSKVSNQNWDSVERTASGGFGADTNFVPDTNKGD